VKVVLFGVDMKSPEVVVPVEPEADWADYKSRSAEGCYLSKLFSLMS
jgi:hypothetical protein